MCSTRARRPAGRRAVQLPAALGALAAARGGRRAQHRRRPPGLAFHDGRVHRGQGAGAERPGGGGRARRRPGRRVAEHRGGAGAGRLPARRTGRGRTRRARRPTGRPRLRRRPGAAAGRLDTRCRDPSGCSTPWPRRRWRAASACPPTRSRTRSRPSGWAGTGPRWSPSPTGSPTSTTPRPPTRTPPRRPCWPTRAWSGWPAVCSRAHRSTPRSPGSPPGWSARCSSAEIAQEVAEALSRHAPDVPVVQVVTGEDAGMDATAVVLGADVTEVKDSGGNLGTSVMTAAVAAARDLAQPGDTVLLAPAGASFDQFSRLRRPWRRVRGRRARGDPVGGRG